jgi:hypothetical protein
VSLVRTGRHERGLAAGALFKLGLLAISVWPRTHPEDAAIVAQHEDLFSGPAQLSQQDR